MDNQVDDQLATSWKNMQQWNQWTTNQCPSCQNSCRRFSHIMTCPDKNCQLFLAKQAGGKFEAEILPKENSISGSCIKARNPLPFHLPNHQPHSASPKLERFSTGSQQAHVVHPLYPQAITLTHL